MRQRVLWINPLGTDVFDEPIRDELERVKLVDTEVEVRSLGRGPHHLEYSCYEAAAVPDILALLAQAEGEGFDAAVIGCFYDTALRPAREITSRMAVAAPCESALHIASTLGDSFSIVVGRRKWVPEMRDNVRRYGFGDRVAGSSPRAAKRSSRTAPRSSSSAAPPSSASSRSCRASSASP